MVEAKDSNTSEKGRQSLVISHCLHLFIHNLDIRESMSSKALSPSPSSLSSYSCDCKICSSIGSSLSRWPSSPTSFSMGEINHSLHYHEAIEDSSVTNCGDPANKSESMIAP